MSQDRYPVFATVMTLTLMKNRLKGAEKGYSLLKKKSDALTVRFREILKEIVADKERTGTLMKDAAFSLTSVKYTAGESIAGTVRENVQTASTTLMMGTENAMGVKLPVFRRMDTHGADQELTGLARGGQTVKVAKETFQSALEGLIRLASLQTSFITLDKAIQSTNRRVNALEYIITPKIRATIAYIESEIDEQSREEFFRIKMIQSKKVEVERKKKRDLAQSAARRAKSDARSTGSAGTDGPSTTVSSPVANGMAQLHGDDVDDDLVF
jgi:V-type H+-transporting ATPase subunit D